MHIQALVLALICSSSTQDPPPQKDVDAAIKKGAEWLLKRFENGFENTSWNSTLELVMLTLSHANVKKDHPVFQKGMKSLLDSKLQFGYRVSLHAMALQRIDPQKHKDRIVHCAQWLVDTQGIDGDWGYPGTLTSMDAAPDRLEVNEPKKTKPRRTRRTSAKIKIRRKRVPNKKLTGDISNTQFALLGLRACEQAGVQIPRATWKGAERYLTRIQRRDGGWGYYISKTKDKTSYASMTCAGVCGIAVALHYQKKKPQRDRRIRAGMAWLKRNWSVTKNSGVEGSHVVDPQVWHYYYLYSIERTGRIMQTDKFGKEDWYAAGAKWLLQKQKKDGSWNTGLTTQWNQAGDLEVADTCFAILFLAKATPPLVETGGKK